MAGGASEGIRCGSIFSSSSARLSARKIAQALAIAVATKDVIIGAAHPFQPVGLCVSMGPGGLGQRLSTLSGGGLWAQVWFGQPATLRVSRNRDSSGKSAKEPARAVVGGDGRVLDALLSTLSSRLRQGLDHRTRRPSHRGGVRPPSSASEPMADSVVRRGISYLPHMQPAAQHPKLPRR
jgi:hypothetical protein